MRPTHANGQPLVLTIQNPHELWFASRSDDVLRSRASYGELAPREYKNGGANWKLVSSVMTALCERLIHISRNRPSLKVALPAIPMSAADVEVLTQWFGNQEVVGDPNHIRDGHRRLSNSWGARADAILPVRSHVWSSAPSWERAALRRSAREVLEEAKPSVWWLNAGLREWLDER